MLHDLDGLGLGPVVEDVTEDIERSVFESLWCEEVVD